MATRKINTFIEHLMNEAMTTSAAGGDGDDKPDGGPITPSPRPVGDPASPDSIDPSYFLPPRSRPVELSPDEMKPFNDRYDDIIRQFGRDILQIYNPASYNPMRGVFPFKPRLPGQDTTPYIVPYVPQEKPK